MRYKIRTKSDMSLVPYSEILKNVMDQIISIIHNCQASVLPSLISCTVEALKIGDETVAKINGMDTPKEKLVALFAAVESAATIPEAVEAREIFLETLLNFKDVPGLSNQIRDTISNKFNTYLEVVQEPEANFDRQNVFSDETDRLVRYINHNPSFKPSMSLAKNDENTSLKKSNPKMTTLLFVALCVLTLCLATVCILTVKRRESLFIPSAIVQTSKRDPVKLLRSLSIPKIDSLETNYINPQNINNEHEDHLETTEDESIFWKNLPAFATAPYLKISGNQHNERHQTGSRIIGDVKKDTVVVVGTPMDCNETTVADKIKDHVFQYTTKLEISEIKDCYIYISLVFNSWTFPQIQILSLHKIAIRKSEFSGLVRFIDRHNETIRKLEINECYLCPDCDLVMINIPDHEFHLAIKGRREKVDMI